MLDQIYTKISLKKILKNKVCNLSDDVKKMLNIEKTITVDELITILITKYTEDIHKPNCLYYSYNMMPDYKKIE